MSAYKDKTQGTWYVSFRYIDWTGKKTQKLKRGFKTKKEALNYEKEFIRKTAADMKMEMNSFIQVYFEDKKNELKENSIRNKQHMMNKHIVPYFGTRKMNEITPAEIIQWQNAIQEKGYSKTYERMIQNQLNALFNHAQKIYNLKENPCKKVKKMGKSEDVYKRQQHKKSALLCSKALSGAPSGTLPRSKNALLGRFCPPDRRRARACLLYTSRCV